MPNATPARAREHHRGGQCGLALAGADLGGEVGEGAPVDGGEVGGRDLLGGGDLLPQAVGGRDLLDRVGVGSSEPPHAARANDERSRAAARRMESGRVELDAHRLGEIAAEGHVAGREAHRERAAERLALEDLHRVADPDPARLEVAQHVGVGVRDAHEAPALTGVERLQRAGVSLLDREVRAGDRIAVRVVGRVAELGRDPRLEVLGEDVLERLGLLVHAVPRHPEVLGEVELEQPVVAQHLERDALAGGGERDPAVGRVGDEPLLGELLDHAARRRGGHAEPRGEVVRGDAGSGLEALLQRVDGLRVVLDGLGRAGAVLRGGHQTLISRPVENMIAMPASRPVTATGCNTYWSAGTTYC